MKLSAQLLDKAEKLENKAEKGQKLNRRENRLLAAVSKKLLKK